jgi:uncharacterized protein YaaN involved in tellurite resistance
MSDFEQKAFEPVIDVSELPEDVRNRAQVLSKQIDVQDSQAIIQYGVSAQTKIGGFADTMLSEIRAKDSGYVGDILTDLVLKIKHVDVDGLGGHSFLESIPILGGLVNRVKRFVARYDKLSVQIEKTINELEKARMDLLRDITMLDGMYGKNLDYLQELDVLIAAGQLKLQELHDKALPELKAKAEKSGDPVDAQRLQDFGQFLNRFEKKLHDLKLSRMVGIQTSPQIRLIQNNDQVLVEKIQSSILNTIPLWKNQIVIATRLFRQKQALGIQREVTNTTNERLAKNAEMLEDSSLEVAKESERGIVDIETLKKVNTDLISTIEETLKIQQEGKQKRQEAERELSRMEGELKQTLQNVHAE